MLKIENNLIHEQTNGLSQHDTLIQPEPSGNCMNWVLGHLLDSQITMLSLLGGESPVEPAVLERYRRESEPILVEGEGVLELQTLLAGHDQVFASITTQLNEMTEADFEQEIQQGERRMTRGWRVFFLHFHYTFHIGQLELLRQMAGKTDKII
jgi:hypothetical protein